MKIKIKNEYNEKSLTELKKIINELIIIKNAHKVKAQKEKNLRAYKNKRKEIALIKTIIRKKELEENG